ncbi:MAG: class A beta-lactamase, subclass A2 [Bacteroidales bacterium]|nr:class A beta-lactamase, subclass A2 [Bacteroidales bacterium]
MTSPGSKFFLSIILMTGISYSSIAQNQELNKKIQSIVEGKNLKAGVAIKLIETGDTISINAADLYPMQSVYKFHLALAVYDKVQKGEFSINDSIYIKKSDLLPNTWSPIRDRYPEGNINMKLYDILGYTVSQSDNVGCDILFRLLGGPEYVNDFIALNGIKDISIKATEEEMHKSWDVQFINSSTPWAAVLLLEKFFKGEIINGINYQLLWDQMVNSSTGVMRIKNRLPEGTILAHKTGSSGTNSEGITAATNDIGIICLPGGRHLVLAVFVTNSRENSSVNEAVIADIAYEAYSYFLSK